MVGAHSCITMNLKSIKRVIMTQPNEPHGERAKRMMGIGSAVLEFFDKHPNQVVHLNDIAEQTGFPKDRVQNAISNLALRNTANAKQRLKVEIRGQAWTWRSGKLEGDMTKLDTLYVQVYESQSGRILVEDEKGVLYPLGDPI